MGEFLTALTDALPPAPALFGQMLVGLINGSFYAMLSLGLAVIFGLLNIVNFTHGAQYMLGGLAAHILLTWLGIGYWPSLIIAPLAVGLLGIALERLFLRHLYRLDQKQFPESLDALVPKYLDSIPDDPCARKKTPFFEPPAPRVRAAAFPDRPRLTVSWAGPVAAQQRGPSEQGCYPGIATMPQ